MGILYLPCEIYHREFDAKLLLAIYLFKYFKHQTIIGYSNYYSVILQSSAAGVLLDKSCSSIMWRGRIKHALARGGKVIVNDEEGFIHINEKLAHGWLSRVDKNAAQAINDYFCWGSIDYSFFSKRIPELQDKLSIVGNCRSDLVSKIGKDFYKEKVEAMREIYGRFYLCSDNFGIERRRGNYTHPKYDISKEDNMQMQKQYDETTARNTTNRELFSDILEEAIVKNPDANFVVRPHPLADPRWWSSRFWKYHNVHIINILNLEPWLLASEGLISMGCTSALQAQLAGIDSLNIISQESNNQNEFAFSDTLLGLKIKDGKQLSDYIDWRSKNNQRLSRPKPSDMKILKSIWKTSEEMPIAMDYARRIDDLMPQITANSFNNTANHIVNMRSALQNLFKIDPDKWATPSFLEVKKKHRKWANVIQCHDSKISKLCNGLYSISSK